MLMDDIGKEQRQSEYCCDEHRGSEQRRERESAGERGQKGTTIKLEREREGTTGAEEEIAKED